MAGLLNDRKGSRVIIQRKYFTVEERFGVYGLFLSNKNIKSRESFYLMVAHNSFQYVCFDGSVLPHYIGRCKNNVTNNCLNIVEHVMLIFFFFF